MTCSRRGPHRRQPRGDLGYRRHADALAATFPAAHAHQRMLPSARARLPVGSYCSITGPGTSCAPDVAVRTIKRLGCLRDDQALACDSTVGLSTAQGKPPMTTTSGSRVAEAAAVHVAHWATAVVAVVQPLTAAYLWFVNRTWKHPPDIGTKGQSAPHRYSSAAVIRLVLGLRSSVIEHIVPPNCHPFRVGNLSHRRLPRTTFTLGLITRFRALAGLAESITATWPSAISPASGS